MHSHRLQTAHYKKLFHIRHNSPILNRTLSQILARFGHITQWPPNGVENKITTQNSEEAFQEHSSSNPK